MLAIIFGLLFMVLGLWGVVAWWGSFMVIVKGLFPILFVFGGLLAIVAGATSIRDSIESRVTEKEPVESKK